MIRTTSRRRAGAGSINHSSGPTAYPVAGRRSAAGAAVAVIAAPRSERGRPARPAAGRPTRSPSTIVEPVGGDDDLDDVGEVRSRDPLGDLDAQLARLAAPDRVRQRLGGVDHLDRAAGQLRRQSHLVAVAR